MDFREVVKKRKSIRVFEKREIEEEKIREILEVVNLTPSAGNLQAYKVFVVKNHKKKEELMRATGYQEFVSQAPVVLVFCANKEESALRYGQRGRKLYSLQDATIACSYAQLAATNLNLASCWVGAFNEEEVQKILNTHLLPIAILPLGYPAKNPPRHLRKSLSEISEII